MGTALGPIGSLTIADIGPSTAMGMSLAGTIALSGRGRPEYTRLLAGAIAMSGTIYRRMPLSLAGSITLAGTVAILEVILVLLGGVLGLSGSILRTTSKQLGGQIVLAGGFLRQRIRPAISFIRQFGTIRPR